MSGELTTNQGYCSRETNFGMALSGRRRLVRQIPLPTLNERRNGTHSRRVSRDSRPIGSERQHVHHYRRGGRRAKAPPLGRVARCHRGRTSCNEEYLGLNSGGVKRCSNLASLRNRIRFTIDGPEGHSIPEGPEHDHESGRVSIWQSLAQRARWENSLVPNFL